jgi:hypothetical protein
MWALRLLLLGASVALASCATPMAMRDIQAIKPNCSRIDKQIAALEHEKAENDQRLIAGIQSVYPALAELSLASMARMSPSPLESGLEPSIASSRSLGAPSGPARLGATILSG